MKGAVPPPSPPPLCLRIMVCRKCFNITEDDEWLALRCDGLMQDFLASYCILFICPTFICSFWVAIRFYYSECETEQWATVKRGSEFDISCRVTSIEKNSCRIQERGSFPLDLPFLSSKRIRKETHTVDMRCNVNKMFERQQRHSMSADLNSLRHVLAFTCNGALPS